MRDIIAFRMGTREGSQEKCDVEGVSGIGSPEDDRKMCGWIEC